MTTSHLECPKCTGRMDLGFIIDEGYATRTVSSWAQGPPQKSFWSGTKLPDDGAVPIGTYRCSSCGYLEAYARHEFAAK